MITSIAHATIYVLNQEEALDFYQNKLGFEVGDDMKVEGGFRWLTVHPKSKPQLQLVLAEPKEGPMFSKDAAEKIRNLITEGAFGAGVFETENCHRTYEELVAKGVEFIQPPTKQLYGVEAMAIDNSGNWFSLVER
ncbi:MULTISPECIES: VOC family protein [Pseudoalteromonas]|uniref:VOC family protein n=1 Tax=Pseudoalteromonas obscura TaxID=3048491 RepID=A0ABT7EFF2_9GAMM|nr:MULTISPECIES: VOC family protein [Pseudoalteromonas]MBQ4835733.1 VOC family protein [Pseudoalteromonas luteoviolacea]MDK2594015.1 VOC family protein [Pseudoalteromonas sp. P94(2023)]